MFICWSQIEDIERDYLDGAIDFPTYWQSLNAIYQNPACWASQTYTILITNNQVSDGLLAQMKAPAPTHSVPASWASPTPTTRKKSITRMRRLCMTEFLKQMDKLFKVVDL
ncbi:MAG: hypothetical protein R3C61_17295 [Bacteroidia bacterium]